MPTMIFFISLHKSDVISQVRPEPLFQQLNVFIFSGGVIFDLIFANFADGKIGGLGMGKIDAGNGGGREHGQGLRQLDARVFGGLHQAPHGLLLQMIRLGWVAGSRTDALQTDSGWD